MPLSAVLRGASWLRCANTEPLFSTSSYLISAFLSAQNCLLPRRLLLSLSPRFPRSLLRLFGSMGGSGEGSEGGRGCWGMETLAALVCSASISCPILHIFVQWLLLCLHSVLFPRLHFAPAWLRYMYIHGRGFREPFKRTLLAFFLTIKPV